MKKALGHNGLQVGDAHGLGSVFFLRNDILAATTLDPFTHVYSFDIGFPPSVQRLIAAKFNASTHVVWLASFQPPSKIIDDYGFIVHYVNQLTTKMYGKSDI